MEKKLEKKLLLLLHHVEEHQMCWRQHMKKQHPKLGPRDHTRGAWPFDGRPGLAVWVESRALPAMEKIRSCCCSSTIWKSTRCAGGST